MNSFRPLVYLSVGANATRCFCRGSGLVQGLLSPEIGRTYQRHVDSRYDPGHIGFEAEPHITREFFLVRGKEGRLTFPQR